MKALTPLLLTFSMVQADWEISGNVALDSEFFLKERPAKHKNAFTFSQEIEAKYSANALSLDLKFEAQQDWYDLSTTQQHNERTFSRLNEAWLKYEFENDEVAIGRTVKFWGALEAYNPADIFNVIDYRNSPTKESKIGTYATSYTHFFENSELSVIATSFLNNQPFAATSYYYYFLPPFVSYDKQLRSDQWLERPNLYVSYSGSTDSDYPLDYAVILMHGFDNQRYFNADKPENLVPISPTFGQPVVFNQEAYLVNKVVTYDTWVVDSWLLKLEATYTDVIANKVGDAPVLNSISDYVEVGVGFEYTLEQLVNGYDLGVIAEHYNYETLQKGDAFYDDLTLFIVNQNDLFTGLRLSLNDADDSSLLVGAMLDFEYGEEVYSAKYESRWFDTIKVEGYASYIDPSKREPTAYALIGQSFNVGATFGYYF